MPQNSLPPLDERQRFSVNEAIAYLRTSRASFYKLTHTGQLRLIKHGRRSYVSGADIARLSATPPPTH